MTAAATLSALLGGLLRTLQLAGVVLALGSLGGVAFGAAAAYGGAASRLVAGTLLLLSRGIPLLVQAFAIFYLLPLTGLKLTPFATAVLALALFATVTIGEIVRGAMRAVPHGQREAAAALGLRPTAILLRILLPQILRAVAGPLVGQFVFLIKATSLISLLGVSELMLTARETIERDLEGLKVMSLVWLLYTLVCAPLSLLSRWMEARCRVARA